MRAMQKAQAIVVSLLVETYNLTTFNYISYKAGSWISFCISHMGLQEYRIVLSSHKVTLFFKHIHFIDMLIKYRIF